MLALKIVTKSESLNFIFKRLETKHKIREPTAKCQRSGSKRAESWQSASENLDPEPGCPEGGGVRGQQSSAACPRSMPGGQAGCQTRVRPRCACPRCHLSQRSRHLAADCGHIGPSRGERTAWNVTSLHRKTRTAPARRDGGEPIPTYLDTIEPTPCLDKSVNHDRAVVNESNHVAHFMSSFLFKTANEISRTQ